MSSIVEKKIDNPMRKLNWRGERERERTVESSFEAERSTFHLQRSFTIERCSWKGLSPLPPSSPLLFLLLPLITQFDKMYASISSISYRRDAHLVFFSPIIYLSRTIVIQCRAAASSIAWQCIFLSNWFRSRYSNRRHIAFRSSITMEIYRIERENLIACYQSNW